VFKKIRILILLLILASVSSTFLLQKEVTNDWQGTLDIRIIPVLADQKAKTASFVNSLEESDFSNIERYLIAQAKRFNVDLEHSLEILLEEPITSTPPVIPNTNASRLDIIFWSLKLRWWAWKNELPDHHVAQIRLYILYQSPEDNNPLPHSTGLQNGLIGLVNARALTKRRPLHQVIITHELLHIFGSKDKYQLGNGQPIYPDGYAKPNFSPLYPQSKAELMARSIPISKSKSKVAVHLNNTLIGKKTALEIGWLK